VTSKVEMLSRLLRIALKAPGDSAAANSAPRKLSEMSSEELGLERARMDSYVGLSGATEHEHSIQALALEVAAKLQKHGCYDLAALMRVRAERPLTKLERVRLRKLADAIGPTNVIVLDAETEDLT
jgi:hypothetical protein